MILILPHGETMAIAAASKRGLDSPESERISPDRRREGRRFAAAGAQ
jgi:hypothetical protein